MRRGNRFFEVGVTVGLPFFLLEDGLTTEPDEGLDTTRCTINGIDGHDFPLPRSCAQGLVIGFEERAGISPWFGQKQKV